MKKSVILRVINTVDYKDKNGNSYRNIQVATPGVVRLFTDEGEMSVKVKSRTSSFNAWEVSYLLNLKGGSDFGWDVKKGDILAGTIVTRKVKTAVRDSSNVITHYEDTYIIENEGRQPTVTNEYSAVVLGDTADEAGFEAAIRQTFRRADHPLVEDIQQSIALLAPPKSEEVLEGTKAKF